MRINCKSEGLGGRESCPARTGYGPSISTAPLPLGSQTERGISGGQGIDISSVCIAEEADGTRGQGMSRLEWACGRGGSGFWRILKQAEIVQLPWTLEVSYTQRLTAAPTACC